MSCPSMPYAMQATVVQRAVVAVLTRGTISDPGMLQSQPDPAWLLALCEQPAKSGGAECAQIGACFLDAASGQLILGEWCATQDLLSSCFPCSSNEVTMSLRHCIPLQKLFLASQIEAVSQRSWSSAAWL